MAISKDIHLNYPSSSNSTLPGQLITRTGTLRAEGSVGSEEEMSVRPSKELNSAQKAEFIGKFDNADNIFMEDVSLALKRAPLMLISFCPDHRRYLAPLWRSACASTLHRVCC